MQKIKNSKIQKFKKSETQKSELRNIKNPKIRKFEKFEKFKNSQFEIQKNERKFDKREMAEMARAGGPSFVFGARAGRGGSGGVRFSPASYNRFGFYGNSSVFIFRHLSLFELFDFLNFWIFEFLFF